MGFLHSSFDPFPFPSACAFNPDSISLLVKMFFFCFVLFSHEKQKRRTLYVFCINGNLEKIWPNLIRDPFSDNRRPHVMNQDLTPGGGDSAYERGRDARRLA